MLQLSVFSLYQKLRSNWNNLGAISKIVITLSFLAIITTASLYFIIKPQKNTVAEITALPATPPFYPSNNILLKTNSVSLSAGNISVSMNGLTQRSFNYVPSGVTAVSTAPYPDSNHTNLNVAWNENGQDFRAIFYFEAASTPNGQGYATEQQAYDYGFIRTWRVTEVSTYDPYNDWLNWTSDNPEIFGLQSMGNPLTMDTVIFKSAKNGNNFNLQIDNLELNAFLEELQGCYYQNVQCFQAPCNPVLMCNTSASPLPSPSPLISPSPSPSPLNSCNRRTPSLTINPSSTEASPGQITTYTASITNNDSTSCGSSQFNLNVHVPSELTLHLPQPGMVIPAGSSNQMNFTVTAPASNPWNETRVLPISYSITNPLSNLGAGIVGSYTLRQPIPQTYNMYFKLAGVTDNSAENTKVALKFYLKDGTVKSISEPIALKHTTDGVYEANVTISNSLAPGTEFRVKAKGEKHGSVIFCKANDQDQPCGDDEFMTIPNNTAGNLLLYFTGIPLPPGDLNPQDGKVDFGDITLLKTLMGKSQSSLGASEFQVGDLNYDGFINSFDIFLLLKTMEIRYDQ